MTSVQFIMVETAIALLLASGTWILYRRRIVDRAVAFFAIACFVGVLPTMLAIFSPIRAGDMPLSRALPVMPVIMVFALMIDFVPFGIAGLFCHALTNRLDTGVKVLGCGSHASAADLSQVAGDKAPAKPKWSHPAIHVAIGLCIVTGTCDWAYTSMQTPTTAFNQHAYVYQAGDAVSWMFGWLLK